MNYGIHESGAYMDNAQHAFANTFGYPDCYMSSRSDYASDHIWVAKIRSELDAGMPVLYTGTDFSQNPAVGHAWVCDGYTSEGKFNMNWGWGGGYNGLYFMSDLNPGNANHFNSDQGAIIGIHPPNCQEYFEGTLPVLPGGIPFTLSTSDYIHLVGGDFIAGMNLTMHAGNSIVLSPGVHFETGSIGHIFIEGCTGSFDAPVEDRSQPEVSVTETAPTTFTVFPNPTTDNITLQFALPAEGEASLRLLDLTGQTVITMFENQQFPAGEQKIQCALDRLPAGVYFAKLETPGGSTIRKIMKVN
jgi:hypothetical protein